MTFPFAHHPHPFVAPIVLILFSKCMLRQPPLLHSHQLQSNEARVTCPWHPYETTAPYHCFFPSSPAPHPCQSYLAKSNLSLTFVVKSLNLYYTCKILYYHLLDSLIALHIKVKILESGFECSNPGADTC